MSKILYLKPNELKIGQEIKGYSQGCLTSWFTAIVTKIDNDKVYYDKWGERPEEVEITSDLTFRVEASDEWYADTYKNNIDWLNKKFTNTELHDMPKEMDNSWLDYNPYRMTNNAKDDDITILGICLNPPYIKQYADMAIVFEYNSSFEKSWMHIDKDTLKSKLKDLCLWDLYGWEE